MADNKLYKVSLRICQVDYWALFSEKWVKSIYLSSIKSSIFQHLFFFFPFFF